MIKERIADGSFNLNLFVEIMQNDGYITEIDAPERAGISSSDMERTSVLQAEFNEIFNFFYPEKFNDIKFACIATNEGFILSAGAYSYALFNQNIISHEEVEGILIKENQQSGY